MWGGLAALGCGSATPLPGLPNAAQPIKEQPPALEDECQLAFEMYQADVDEIRFRSAPACIRSGGKALAMPSSVTLYYLPYQNPFAPGDREMCADEGVEVVVDKKRTWRCQWNGVFRDRFPMTFRFFVPPQADESKSVVDVGTHIQMIHVFRNGRLVFKWTPDAQKRAEVIVPGGSIESHAVPHLADLDLRVYPTGTPIDDATAARAVEKAKDQLEGRLKIAATTALDTVFADTKKEVQCTLARFDKLRQAVAEAAKAPEPKPIIATPPADCPSPTALADLYRETKGIAGDKAKAAIEALAARMGADAKQAAALLEAGLAALQASETEKIAAIKQQLAALDQIAAETAALLDSAASAVATAKAEVTEFVRDSDQAALVHAKVAEALAKEGDFFEAYGENPPPTGVERTLEMAYADGIQAFWLAPWSGIPFTTKARLEPSGTYVIPIIDVVGWRWQWARSRFADARVAVGSMVLTDRTDDNGDGNTNNDQAVRWAFVPSVSIANLKFGVAILPAADPQPDDSLRRIRFVAGADLFKLISGRDLEAF
jgi:hypothetical protein